MAEIVVKPVVSRRLRSDFLNFPWELYRNDPNWVPPLLGNLKEMAGFAHHPFYAENQIQNFVAYRDGKVCGRIGAILNLGHFERYKERRGYFGFIEMVDDQDVAQALFDAARGWLAERDVHAMRGTDESLDDVRNRYAGGGIRLAADVHDGLQPSLL